MAAEQHTVTVGDTLSPLNVQLMQKDTTGVLASVDLTGKVVRFFMVNSAGTSVVAETVENVTVTDATAGQVQYDFQAADVDTAGTYYGWFRVYDDTEYDTYPSGGRKLTILIVAAA
jgi:hypothetical protein